MKIMTNGNDAAFARPLGEVLDPGEPAISDEQEGLTKREYFAAIAMGGLIGTSEAPSWQVDAKNAIQMADALIDALNEESK